MNLLTQDWITWKLEAVRMIKSAGFDQLDLHQEKEYC